MIRKSVPRHGWLPTLSAILFSTAGVRALPTAVNDTYFGSEDVPLTVLGQGSAIVNASFETGADGFTYVDDPFGTNRPNNATGAAEPDTGNPGGALKVELGRVNFNGDFSGGWRRTFTLSAPATVRVSFDWRIATRGGLEADESSAAVFDLNGIRYGSVGTAPALFLGRIFGVGNSPLDIYSTWTAASYDIPLAAGTHTLTLGGFGHKTTVNSEYTNQWFDNVLVSNLSGGSGVLGNDTGLAPLTAVKDTNPAHGSVVLNSDGTFLYTPVANYNGPDSFTYHAVDSTGNSAPATVTLNIAAVNDVPVANNDNYSTNEDTPLTVNAPGLLANDTDADGNPLTAALRSPPGKGNVTVNANGSFTYTPAANANGADSFTYRINDGTANSADATVNLTVNPSNDAPVSAADAYRTPVNTPLVVTLTDPGGQPTTTETLVAAGSPVPLGDPAEADLPVWRFLDNGTDQGTAWRTPAFDDSSWSTGKAELGYGDDGEGRPERTVVEFGGDTGARYATTYFRTTFQVVDKSALSSLELLLMRDDAAVIYLNGTEIYRDQSENGFPNLPANPAFDAYANGTISNADEGALRDLTTFMTANPAQYLVEGANVLAVEIHQAAANSSDVSMDLQLTAQRGPYAGVLYNDIDPDGTTPTAQIVTPPATGSLSLNANGTFTYTPAGGFTGIATFVYRATDGVLFSANTTVTITVASAGNAPPLAADDAYSTNEDTPLNIGAPGLLANDSDPENGALTAQPLTSPAHGSLTLNTDGSFLYAPVANCGIL